MSKEEEIEKELDGIDEESLLDIVDTGDKLYKEALKEVPDDINLGINNIEIGVVGHAVNQVLNANKAVLKKMEAANRENDEVYRDLQFRTMVMSVANAKLILALKRAQ